MVRNKACLERSREGQPYRRGRSRRRSQGGAGTVARAERWRQMLGPGHERAGDRGTEDILLAIVDGLKGFPEAITAVSRGGGSNLHRWSAGKLDGFHLLEGPQRARDGAEGGLPCPGADAAEHAPGAFKAGPWGTCYPAIDQNWRIRAEVILFSGFSNEVRRITYSTNSIEAPNWKLRRAMRARGHFPSNEAATKLLHVIFNQSMILLYFE